MNTTPYTRVLRLWKLDVPRQPCVFFFISLGEIINRIPGYGGVEGTWFQRRYTKTTACCERRITKMNS